MKELTKGAGRARVTLKIQGMGDDISMFLSGGSSHIGCVVMAEPGQETQRINAEGHMEHVVAVPLAEAAAKKFKKRVVCIAGVHIAHATKEEIEEIKRNCTALAEEL